MVTVAHLDIYLGYCVLVLGRKSTNMSKFTVKFIGKTTTFQGKRLFDILCRLKDFGVGRVVYRNRFNERYTEPSYYVITKVDVDMSDPTQVSDNMGR